MKVRLCQFRLADVAAYRKGIRLIFRNQVKDVYYGNINELRNTGGDPGKSSLFFLTNGSRASVRRTKDDPGINLVGEGVRSLVKHSSFRSVRCISDGP